MLTHFKSTLRILRMLIRLSTGCVTLLPGKFQPPEFPPIGLLAPGGLMLGFAPIF